MCYYLLNIVYIIFHMNNCKPTFAMPYIHVQVYTCSVHFPRLNNKVPQTTQLKTAEIYPLIVLEARSQKWRGWRCQAPSQGSGADGSWPLAAFGGDWQSLASLGVQQRLSHVCLHRLTVFFPVCLCVCVSVSVFI